MAGVVGVLAHFLGSALELQRMINEEGGEQEQTPDSKRLRFDVDSSGIVAVNFSGDGGKVLPLGTSDNFDCQCHGECGVVPEFDGRNTKTDSTYSETSRLERNDCSNDRVVKLSERLLKV